MLLIAFNLLELYRDNLMPKLLMRWCTVKGTKSANVRSLEFYKAFT
jgi:hypothetical protein